MIASDLDIAIQALRTCLDFGNLFLLEYIKNFKAVPAINFTAEVEVRKNRGHQSYGCPGTRTQVPPGWLIVRDSVIVMYFINVILLRKLVNTAFLS